jgi:hypothetical protein
MQGNQDMQMNRSKQVAKKPGKRMQFSPMKIVFMAFFAAVTVLSIAILIFVAIGGSKSESELIKKDKYQAVFLSDTSGQVYFGKLKSVNSKYYQLTDIFYVKVDNAVQPDKTNTSSQNISLAKLGNELHGPEDFMYISRDKVLFWENLKDDGQVVKAITDFKKNGSQSTNTQSTTQSQTNTSQTTNSTTNKSNN